MTERIRERLKDLAAFLELQHAVESIDETLEHLQSAVAAAMVQSRATAQQCTLLLFQSTANPPSLLAFLDASAHMSEDMRKREIAHAREKVLDVLAMFLKLYGAHAAVLKKQVVALVTRCQLLARVDASNKVRAAAFSVMINALKHSERLLTNQDVQPAQYTEKLFHDLKFAKATQTTKGLAVEMIGHLAKRFPSDVEPMQSQLVDWVEDALDKQFTTTAPEMLVVKGLLFLLGRLLVFEPDRYQKLPDKRQKIYSYLTTVLATTVSGQLSRYHVTKAALQFLSTNSAMLRDDIGANSVVWFSFMKFCCTSENKTIKEHAFACSDSVLTIVGDVLAENTSDGDKKAFNRIVKELLPVLNNPDASSSTLSFALQCLGKLARSIRVFLGASGFAKIEDKLRSYGESLLALEAKATAMKWSIVSQYLECIGRFIQQNEGAPLADGYVNFIGDLLCHVVAAYPRCVWKTKHLIYKSMLHIFDAVSKRAVLKLLVDRFVYHSLLLTISNLTESDAAVTLYHPETGNVETRLLFDYEAFWVGLVRVSGPASAFKASLKLELLDSFVKCILRVIAHLDLSYSYDTETSSSGKDVGGYKPRVARDHTIMLNLTEFFRRIVPQLTPESLAPWVPLLIQDTIQRAEQLPLVSSFYHIGTVLGRVSEHLAFFASPPGSDSARERLHAGGASAIVGLREEYALFLQRVCKQLRFYKDELLVASAEFVLSAPLSLISVDSVVPALLSTLDIGKSHLPAAEIGVSALERWLKVCPAQLEAALPDVIPLLAPYLSRSDDDESDSLDQQQQPTGLRASKAAVLADEDGVTELGKIQRRILIVLGSTGGKGATLISKLKTASSSGSSDDGSVEKHSVPQFQLSLELSDTSITLALDQLLAQTGDVAVASTDRRIKVAACETYHALVCYLCGKTATHPHASERKSVFFPAWKRAFPTVLVLATDPETVCRALFEPLLFQVLRWLCSASEMYPFEYSMILDELVAGLSQAKNNAVREVAGKALAAVLSFSIETDGGASRGVAKAEGVFERLFALCRHPSSVQRIGAATAINYVVRSLNQDNSEVISAFALRCVKTFLCSLRLCDRDDESGRGGMDVARGIIQRSIAKLERAIARFPHVFIKKAAHRSMTSTEATLDETAEWLFAQTMKRERSFRETCQKVFVTFAPLVSGSSSKKWLLDYADQGADIAALLAPMDVLARVLNVRGAASGASSDTIEWLEQFAASMEAYAWCVQLLGDRAGSVLSTSSASSAALKRKSGEESARAVTDDRQHALAWAISTFLSLEYPGERAIGSDIAAYAERKRLIESHGAALASLCRLAAPVFTSTRSTATLSWLIDASDRAFCEALAQRVTLVLADDSLAHWSVNAEALAAIKAFCAAVMASGSAFADQLQRAATDRLDPLVQALDEANVRAGNTDDSKRMHCASAFLTQLLECNVVSQHFAKRYKQTFADAALRSIQTLSSPAQHQRVALAALKTALLCGWDIARAFLDADSRTHFAPIYHDIVACLPQPKIWRESASHLVGGAADDSQVLSVLADVLSAVVGLRVFPAATPEWDAFTELLLPKAKRFVQSIRVSGLELQHQRMALQVLLHLVEIYEGCTTGLRDVLRIGPVPDIRDVTVEVLSRRDTSYLVKADALAVLARLARGASNDKSARVLIETLKTFMAEEFPIVSTDVKRGTKEFDVFALLFRHVLVIVEESRSIAFLQLLYAGLAEGPQHLFASDVTRALASFAEKLASTSSAVSATPSRSTSAPSEAAALLELADVLLDAPIDVVVRKTLLESVFTPMMELQSARALKMFFLTETANAHGAAKHMTMLSKFATLIANSAEISTTGSFFSAAVAYALVEMLFRLGDPEFIRTEINSAFLGHANGKGREFTMLVCKSASKLITKAHGDVDATLRFACVEAYNCLLTAVSKTQKQEKFFDQILFQEALWPNVVDVAQALDLRAETGAFATIPLSTFSAATLKAQQQTQDGASVRSPRGTRSRSASAALQFFTGSSLSQTASLETTSTQSLVEQRVATSAALYKNVVIELDAINEHPSMIPLLRVLLLMKDEFGAHWDAVRMPSWMQKLFNVLSDALTELAIRVFIAKVVLNVPELFTPYAATWLGKILETVLEATAASQAREFNYLLRDCCHLVLGAWRDVSVASLRRTPSQFITTLIELTPHAVTTVLHDNILLVTQLIVLWRDAVVLDTLAIESFLFSENPEARLEAAERTAALQIVSAMVAAGALDALQAEMPSGSGNSVVDGIVLALQHKRASVYTVAAEVAGQCLKTFATASPTVARAVQDEIAKAYNQEDYGRFLALVRSVSLHDPRVIDAMMLQRLCSVLPKVIAVDAWSRAASESLENAAKNADVSRLLFPSIQPVLPRFISHRDASVQFATLRAMDSVADGLGAADTDRLLTSSASGGIGLLSHYEAHGDPSCRKLMYAIATRFFRKDDLSPTLRDTLRRTLLSGLCDPDASIRAELLAFWSASEMLPTASRLRLVALFDALYAPELADKWVFYATNALVVMAQGAADYDTPLFASALTKSEFRDAAIDVTWEGKTQTMAPMFSVESDAFAAKLMRARDSESLSESFIGSLTQDPFGGGSVNQSQLLTSSLGSTQLSQSLSGSDAAGKHQRRRRFAKRATSTGSTAAPSRSRATSDYFKEQYTLLHKHQHAIATRHRRARKQHVSIKRRYRVGDFPDIQIKTRDIMEPIMVLCESHAPTSSLIFAGFFASIVLSAGFQRDASSADALVERMQQTLVHPTASPTFVCCVHLAYYTTLVTDPSAVSDLALSATAIGGSTLASGRFHSGELILEELLNAFVHSRSSGAGCIDFETADAVTEYRDQLYKVLATVQKSDLLIALASTCCSIDETKAALQARIAGDLPLAIASYKKAESLLAALDEPMDDGADDRSTSLPRQFEAQRCYWERLACLERLNHWDKLDSELLSSDSADVSVLYKQEPPYLEQGLGHCIRAYIGATERVRDDTDAREAQHDKFRAFLDGATAAPHVWDLLASTYCVELCLMYLELGETSRVRVLVETFYAKFLARWQSTSSVAPLPRLELMQSLSSVVQLDELLVLTQAPSDDTARLERAYVAFSDRWTRAPPSDGFESVSCWSRFYMVQRVASDFVCAHGTDESILSDAAMRALQVNAAHVMLQYGKVAVANDVLALASKYLKDYRDVCNKQQLPKVSALMIDVFVSHVLKLAERQAQTSRERSSTSGALSTESITAISRYYHAAARMFDNDDILTVLESADARERVAIGALEARAFGKAAQFYFAAGHDAVAAEESFTRSLDVFERSCKTVASLASSTSDSATLAAFRSCRLAFVEFLVELLFSDASSSGWEAFVTREKLTQLLVENVLDGMAMGDQACSNYLPQLCEAIAPYPALVALFERQVLTTVPTWTCLRWAAQLMALLNGPIGDTVARVLEKMASEYPAALFYDFKVTCSGSAKAAKTDLSRLTALLANPVMEKFVDALRLVHHPELRLKEGLKEVARCLDEAKTSMAADLVDALWTDCFATEKTLLGGLIGRYNREWAKKTRPHMEKLLGKNGRSLSVKAVASAREWIANNFAVVPGRHGITKDMKARLVDFAEWLDEFDHTKARLELPGQYGTYWGKPDPSSHVEILSFSSMLGVLASKQLPKQITMHCSDEQDYTFLVKGGEDLRLDQRIEQLFDVMNQILHADARCRDRHLVTRTYKVLPMTHEIGIIEWLHGTATLKSMIERRLQTDSRCTDLASNKRQKLQLFNTTAAKAYETFLLKQRGASFCAKVIAPPRHDVAAAFASVQDAIPADLLRRQLFDMSASFEAFLCVRDEFAKSLAVFSACAYVLGIGDRHLDNFLLDLRTGAVVGIDFGVSFGAGASLLPVPELMPFRYTRQMDAVLQPYDGANLLTQDMQAVFGALRERKLVVESVMNVFLHEPLLDWQKATVTHEREIFAAAASDTGRSTLAPSGGDETSAAMDAGDDDRTVLDHEPTPRGRAARARGSTSSLKSASASLRTSSSSNDNTSNTGARAWLPDVKIAIARRKLEGFSPRTLLKEELAQNPHLRGAPLTKFHALVDAVGSGGNGGDHTPATQRLSPLAQSEELLALATSPDVLGRTYHGWMPWL